MATKVKVYVTGNSQFCGPDQLKQFQIAKEKLTALGFEVYTATDDFENNDIKDTADGKQIIINNRINHVKKCTVTLFLKGYGVDPQSRNEVQLAIHLKTPDRVVMDCQDFISNYEKSNTTADASAITD